MTINYSKQLLTNYFLKNDSITNNDFTKLATKKVGPLEAEAAFTYALNDLEVAGVVSKLIGQTEDGKATFIWVLKQPLMAIPQKVEISGGTAMTVSSIVQDFYKQTGNEDEFSDPMNITESDIHILIEIIEILAERNVEKSTEITETK